MIQIRYKKNQSSKVKKRLKSKAIIRKKINGTKARPRLVIFKSHRHIYAQVVDDIQQVTLTQASTLSEKIKSANCQSAEKIGAVIAEKAKEKGIHSVVFDRNGYVYHGRVRAVAEMARKSGLNF